MVNTQDVVRNILWLHLDSIKLLNAFLIVLICDSTYKTKKISSSTIGDCCVTSTEMIFFFCICLFTILEDEEFWMGFKKGQRIVCEGWYAASGDCH